MGQTSSSTRNQAAAITPEELAEEKMARSHHTRQRMMALNKKAYEKNRAEQASGSSSESPELEQQIQAMADEQMAIEVEHFKGLTEQELSDYYGEMVYTRVHSKIEQLEQPNDMGRYSEESFKHNNRLLDEINNLMIRSKIIPNTNYVLLAHGMLTRFPKKVFQNAAWYNVSIVNLDENYISDLPIHVIPPFKTVTWSVQHNCLRTLCVSVKEDNKALNLLVRDNFLCSVEIPSTLDLRMLDVSKNFFEQLVLKESWVNLEELNVSDNRLAVLKIPETLEKLNPDNVAIEGNPLIAGGLLVDFVNFPATWVRENTSPALDEQQREIDLQGVQPLSDDSRDPGAIIHSFNNLSLSGDKAIGMESFPAYVDQPCEEDQKPQSKPKRKDGPG